MPQQQYQMQQMPGRPFSPPQPSTSPGTPQSFSLPPNKRQRLSPDPRSQPVSPYVQSPYGTSPTAADPSSATASPQFSSVPLSPSSKAAQPISTTASPTVTTTPTAGTPSTGAPRNFSHISVPPNPYTTPYANGNVTPTLSLPSNSVQNHFTSNNPPNLHNNHNSFSYHPPSQGSNGFQPNLQANNNFVHNSHNISSAGTMGPPSKPVERDNTNDDQTDVLANAGVDLRAEESYAMSFYTGSFNSQPTFSQPNPASGGHGFNQFDPGESDSLYGAGPANQPGQLTDQESQDRLQKKAADKAWADAARNLARSREHELHNPHVQVSVLWRKMDKIARDNGLVLNTDPGGKMPTLKLASEFQSEVTMRTAVGPQGAMTVTGGAFLPPDTALADQLALVSLATSQRVRILLEEAAAVARGRFSGSDGVVPAEWVNMAEPAQGSSGTVVTDGTLRNGWERLVSSQPDTLKSLASAHHITTPISDNVKTLPGSINYKGELTRSLREVAATDRELEERRLLRRQNRSADSSCRPGSVVPGTPINSAAPEPSSKPLTKKEREKQDKGKLNAVDNHAQANNTMNTFLGGGKKKKYSWMTGGGSTTMSGAGTPGRTSSQTLPGTLGLGAAAEKVRLTAESMTKIGSIREAKYPLVELRDWVVALENDGKQLRSLQEAYTVYEKK
ncbi:MAG: hypothetical protein M1818_006599 [Claussenomyces sp. TS43310]|nr:MAG: hypothetical protein M1818_006966 [Claussenomyces sp. TS43310]KAI9735022.1 MAG: hypothetical protein M1818_006599 [Claussenomyces sp. TS43310]